MSGYNYEIALELEGLNFLNRVEYVNLYREALSEFVKQKFDVTVSFEDEPFHFEEVNQTKDHIFNHKFYVFLEERLLAFITYLRQTPDKTGVFWLSDESKDASRLLEESAGTLLDISSRIFQKKCVVTQGIWIVDPGIKETEEVLFDESYQEGVKLRRKYS